MIGDVVVKFAAIVALAFSVGLLLQVLAEWASLGGIFLSNGERVGPGTVTAGFLCLLCCALLAIRELAQ